MKTLRAFFEMSALSLLPALVLLLALAGERPAGTAAHVPGRGSPPSAAPAAVLQSFPRAENEVPVPDGEAGPAPEGEAPVPVPAGMGEEAWEEGAPEEEVRHRTRDEAVTVDVLFGEEVRRISLREYLLGVVAAEMPASFRMEALEAQAVAARTDTLYRMLISHPHGEAACCTDPGCCKAWCSEEELRARWGRDYDRWFSGIEEAVDATEGEILVYEGEPIFAAFHAASDGYTEDSENVWLAALPYLRGVDTLETEAEVPGFRRSVLFSREELARRIREHVPDAELSGEPENWLSLVKRSRSGRLLSLRVGGVTLSGSAFRSLLGLRSANVTWQEEGDGLRFETTGFGHGVGLSQYGAEAMASAGSAWEEILLHYYTGAVLADMETVDR